MVIDFPDLPLTMGFVAFSRTVGNLWGNPYISHMLKYTIGWESDGKKVPYYGKRMSIGSPDFPHTMGFVAFSRTVGNVWRNPCISHMMTSVNFFLWNTPMLFEDSSNVFLLRLLKSVISVKYFTSFNSSNMLLNIYLLIKNLIIKPFVLLTNIWLTRTKTLVNNLWKFWWNSNLEHKLRIFEIVILNTKWKKLQIPLTLV